MMMAEIREDLAALNISHDVFFSERSLQGANGGDGRSRHRRLAQARSGL